LVRSMKIKYCPKCGENLSEDARFCMFCGEQIIDHQEEIEDHTFESKRSLVSDEKKNVDEEDTVQVEQETDHKDEVSSWNDDIQSIVREFENSVCKIILSSVYESPFPLGVAKTISILKGTKSTFAIKYELYELDTFSMLTMFTREQLKIIIETLMEMDLLEIKYVSDYGNMPTLQITEDGRNFVVGKHEVNIQFLEQFMDDKVILLDSTDKELYEELRVIRYELAKEEDIPAYHIANDNTLRRLAKNKPEDENSLLSIKGIGEKFIEKYSHHFRSVINEHRNKIENE